MKNRKFNAAVVGSALEAMQLRRIYKGLVHKTERSPHVFASHLILSELDLNEGLDCGEDPPPWPVLHTTVLVDVLLDAADRQILNLNTHTEKKQSSKRNTNRNAGVCCSVHTKRCSEM